jgi:hypothetical protein
MNLACATVAACSAVLISIPAHADWLTFAHDLQRTGWPPEQTDLNPENVSGMSLLWKSKLDVEPFSLFSLTAPVVADNVPTRLGNRTVVYVAGISGAVFAFRLMPDAKTGNPTLEPAWISGNFDHPDPVVIATGVVFALSNGENAVQHGGEKLRLQNTHPAVLFRTAAKVLN